MIGDVIKLGSDLALGIQNPNALDSSLKDIVDKAIRKQSASFVAEGQQLQIATCALIAALQYLDNAKPSGSSKLTLTDVLELHYGVLYHSNLL